MSRELAAQIREYLDPPPSDAVPDYAWALLRKAAAQLEEQERLLTPTSTAWSRPELDAEGPARERPACGTCRHWRPVDPAADWVPRRQARSA